jgi:hypothetical protein
MDSESPPLKEEEVSLSDALHQTYQTSLHTHTPLLPDEESPHPECSLLPIGNPPTVEEKQKIKQSWVSWLIRYLFHYPILLEEEEQVGVDWE